MNKSLIVTLFALLVAPLAPAALAEHRYDERTPPLADLNFVSFSRVLNNKENLVAEVVVPECRFASSQPICS